MHLPPTCDGLYRVDGKLNSHLEWPKTTQCLRRYRMIMPASSNKTASIFWHVGHFSFSNSMEDQQCRLWWLDEDDSNVDERDGITDVTVKWRARSLACGESNPKRQQRWLQGWGQQIRQSGVATRGHKVPVRDGLFFPFVKLEPQSSGSQIASGFAAQSWIRCWKLSHPTRPLRQMGIYPSSTNLVGCSGTTNHHD